MKFICKVYIFQYFISLRLRVYAAYILVTLKRQNSEFLGSGHFRISEQCWDECLIRGQLFEPRTDKIYLKSFPSLVENATNEMKSLLWTKTLILCFSSLPSRIPHGQQAVEPERFFSQHFGNPHENLNLLLHIWLNIQQS